VGRGLHATIAREVPGYGLYFVAYSLLVTSALGEALGPVAALVCGALVNCFLSIFLLLFLFSQPSVALFANLNIIRRVCLAGFLFILLMLLRREYFTFRFFF
jgi:hypothetical protein